MAAVTYLSAGQELNSPDFDAPLSKKIVIEHFGLGTSDSVPRMQID